MVDPNLIVKGPEDKLQTAITLEKSGWKLVADAHSLVLSSEALGGSKLGQPTGTILGRGPCLKVTEYTL